jgi:hypothetical protein
MILLARVKRVLSRFMVLIEFCHRCGRRQPLVWRTDDDLWAAVMGGPGGVLCPECFNKAMWKRGFLLYWRASIGPAQE